MNKASIKSRGFTLVELLVVIVVIGILAAISVVSYTGITQKARQQVALTDATNVKKALDMKSIEGSLSSCFDSVDLGGRLNTNCVSVGSGTTVTDSSIGSDNNSYKATIANGFAYKIQSGDSAPTLLDQNKTVKFDYTGNIVNWTVPAGVTKVNIAAKGAQGGYTTYAISYNYDPDTDEWTPSYKTTIGGKGAYVSADFTVTPGQILSILVGQQPDSPASDYGYSFPGGGGGTFVASGSNYAAATPLLVAGGGGAAGYDWWGFGDTGQGGRVSNINSSGDGGGHNSGTNGNGAPSAECGGGGGGFYTSGGNDIMYYPNAGAGGFGLRQGGAGGSAVYTGYNNYQAGGFGGGAVADYIGYCNTTAGSGGGYSGGSSGSSDLEYGGAGAGIGNGGGSYSFSTTNQFSAADSNEGNGQVIITW